MHWFEMKVNYQILSFNDILRILICYSQSVRIIDEPVSDTAIDFSFFYDLQSCVTFLGSSYENKHAYYFYGDCVN